MIGTCERSPAESYEYVFRRTVWDIVSKVASGLRQQDNYCNRNINKEGVQNSVHLKFVLLLGVALFLQGVDPSKGGKLFNFFHNFLACRASTIINWFRWGEMRQESFCLFFQDIIEAWLFANGHIAWNETFTVPPSTTPEITTPLSELNYWRSVSFLLNFFSFHLDYKLIFLVSVSLYYKVWQNNYEFT